MDNLTKLRYWTFKILPLVYDDSLSYYEVLAKVTNKVNELVDSNNTMPQAITDEITKQLDESYATDINNKINSAVNTVTENANNQIDKLANEVYAKLITAIATDEGTNTFTKDAKSGGELIFLNKTLYKVTAVMPAGTNYIVGTNIVPINISEELKTIKETYISSNNEHWNERATKDYVPDEYLFWKDDLYIATKYIKVNDLLYNSGDNQNIKQITLTSKITNLQSQINGNAGNIEKLLKDAINLQNQITTNNTNVNNRISNIVAQSGNANSEIVDARTESAIWNSVQADSLHDAIVGQIEKTYRYTVKNRYNELTDVNIPKPSKSYEQTIIHDIVTANPNSVANLPSDWPTLPWTGQESMERAWTYLECFSICMSENLIQILFAMSHETGYTVYYRNTKFDNYRDFKHLTPRSYYDKNLNDLFIPGTYLINTSVEGLPYQDARGILIVSGSNLKVGQIFVSYTGNIWTRVTIDLKYTDWTTLLNSEIISSKDFDLNDVTHQGTIYLGTDIIQTVKNLPAPISKPIYIQNIYRDSIRIIQYAVYYTEGKIYSRWYGDDMWYGWKELTYSPPKEPKKVSIWYTNPQINKLTLTVSENTRSGYTYDRQDVSLQDFACYNGTYFNMFPNYMFVNNDTPIPINNGHGNSCSFGTVIHEGDVFPYLYCSSFEYGTNSIYVNRVTETTAELVKTIKYNDINGKLDCCVDESNNRAYIILCKGRNSFEDAYEFVVGDLDGNIILRKDIDIDKPSQGMTYWKGNIILTCGVVQNYKPQIIYTFDTKGNILSHTAVADLGEEIEGITNNGNNLVLATAVHYLTFD